MMKKGGLRTLMAVLTLTGLLTGCVSESQVLVRGTPIPRDRLGDFLEKGQTTKVQVIERFGLPDKALSLAEGPVWVYQEIASRSSNLMFALYIGSSTSQEITSLLIYFDAQGLVSDFKVVEQKSE